jgi:predicted ATP-dependent endonuclease of OLD family
LLKEFHIRNFRCFEDLLLPKLGRVNLIVGKNNVGKSSILEAIRIYASNGQPEVLWDTVKSRDEHKQAKRAGQALLTLFRDRSDVNDAIELGPRDDRLLISVQYQRETRNDDGSIQYTLMENPEGESLIDVRLDLVVKSESSQRRLPLMRDFETYMRRDIAFRREQIRAEALPRFQSVFVAANGLTQDLQAQLWDEVALSSLEQDVINSLRLIVPNLERISLIGSKEERGRSPFVKLTEGVGPIPLRRLGDGVNRLFGMALALVTSQQGILLVDEIENGIHYSVQERLWRFILDVSRRLNVQVFATSHSWDCVKSFQTATADCSADEGILTRLEFADGSVRASQFDEPELEIATREHIEIR